jgi:hypothetical protein
VTKRIGFGDAEAGDGGARAARVTKRIGAVEPPPRSGRLLGELPHRPLGAGSRLSLWGPRVVALVLLALLLIALALIVSGVF